jgi:glycosyltransferase involved in cell wall biosynthesis
VKSVLFLVPHPVESSDYRYRVQQFIPYLERSGYRCTVRPFSTRRLFFALQSKRQLITKMAHAAYCSVRRIVEMTDLSAFDIAVIHREVFPFFTPTLEKWVLRHPRVIFSFDDAVHVGHHDVSHLSHPLLYRLKYGAGIGEVIRRSAHVIAGNRLLADYARKLNSDVTVIPSVVNCEEYSYRPVPDASQPITIGWIGSKSTFQYLFDIEPALQKVAKENPGRVQFVAFGFSGFNLKLPGFAAHPFHLDGEVDYLKTLDIGIMPLPDTEWTRGKCAFKAIQYMAVGASTVASPVGITTDLIKHDVNGLLANSVDDWFYQLDRLVKDAQLRRRLSIAGRRTIEESYSLQVWGPRFAALFDQLSEEELLHAAPSAA